MLASILHHFIVLFSSVQCFLSNSFLSTKLPNGSYLCANVTPSYSLFTDDILGIPSGVPEVVRCAFSCSGMISGTSHSNCAGFNYLTSDTGKGNQCQLYNSSSTQCRATTGDCQYNTIACGLNAQNCITAVDATSCSFPFTYDGQLYFQCAINNSNTCDVGCYLTGRVWASCTPDNVGFTAMNKTVNVTIQSSVVPLRSVNSWLTIMSRVDPSFPTGLAFSAYQAGFGDIMSNFWLGLDRIYQLTNPNVNGGQMYRLRMELQLATDNSWSSIEFDWFHLDPSPTYALHVSYLGIGDTTDIVNYKSNGNPFSMTGVCVASRGPQWQPTNLNLCGYWYVFGPHGTEAFSFYGRGFLNVFRMMVKN